MKIEKLSLSTNHAHAIAPIPPESYYYSSLSPTPSHLNERPHPLWRQVFAQVSSTHLNGLCRASSDVLQYISHECCIILDKCMTLWGEPKGVHKRNIEHLSIHHCHQNVTHNLRPQNCTIELWVTCILCKCAHAFIFVLTKTILSNLTWITKRLQSVFQ